MSAKFRDVGVCDVRDVQGRGVGVRMRAVLAVILAVALVVPSFLGGGVASAKKKASIKLNKSSYVMAKGTYFKLKAKATGKVVWKSSNKRIVTVNKKGKVTAKRKGHATITARLKGTKKKAKCRVTVGSPVMSITIAQVSIHILKGQMGQILATALPDTATNQKLVYKSMNKKITTVSSTGLIRGKKAGTAKIRVYAADRMKVYSEVTVTVSEKEET